jgi:hypothetical protein
METLRTAALALVLAVVIPAGPAIATSPAQTARFCAAVSRWGLSPAVRELQLALQGGDKKDLVEAFRSWTDETQAMVDALPASAPPAARRGFGNLNEAIAGLAKGKRATKRQLRAYRQSRGPVLIYYRQTCS